MIAVTCEDQAGCDDVVSEHLQIVLSPLLDIDDHYLLEPERVLDEDVPFPYSTDLSIRPIGPEVLEVVPVVGLEQNVLSLLEQEIQNANISLPFLAAKRPCSIPEAKPAQQISSGLL